MKKLIILAIILMAVSVGAETSKYGSMWKQNDKTVSPADDVVYVDFTGYTTVGVGGGGGTDFSNITSAIGITFDAIDNMAIDASTTNHTDTEGVIDITLTPSVPSTRGTQVTIDANGQNDTMAHNITYTANGMEAGDVGMAMEINVNPGTSTGGEVEGLRITRTGVGGVEVNAIHVGTRIAPIHQSSGTPENMDIAFLYNSSAFVNATTAFRNDSSTLNYTLVPNTNDYIYIGHANTFSDVELILETTADTSIVPVFEYYTGGWTFFGPNDSTNGLTTDGLWSWDTLTNWVTTTVNGVANKYWIRVQRTAAVTTDAVEKTIDIIIPAEYSWGEVGDITAYDMMLQGTFGLGPTIDVSGAGTRCFWYPKKAAWRCGTVTGTHWNDSSIGDQSHAEGYNTTASGNGAHAEGNSTTTLGHSAHAEGLNTLASQTAAHTEGVETIANGSNGAHAEGYRTTASGAFGAHAEGRDTTASGNYGAHAEGELTIAAGDYGSHAGGRNAYAKALTSFAHGAFINISSSALRSVMFGNYSNATERDANKLTTSDTMKLANMDLIVGGSLLVPASVVTYDNYSVELGNYAVFAHATSNAKNMYLPDATTVDGMHVRFKKKDTTDNHITINPIGGQTIDGNGSKVLEQTNNAIMLYADGGDWEVLQATSVAHYGEIHVHDNSTATDILTASSPHLMQGLFAEEDTDGFVFVAGSTGPISAFAEYSTVVAGTTKVTDVGHGLSSGAILSIGGTTSYNDVFEATAIDADNYYIVDTFVADDATGNWYEGDKLINATGMSGKYKVEFHGFGTPETNNDVLAFHLYKDAIEMTPLESKRRFTSQTDVGAVSASGLTTIADGEAITFSITNTSGSGDFTLEHVNIVINSF